MREVTAADGTTFEVNAPDVSDWVEIVLAPDARNGDLYEARAEGKAIGQLRFFRDFPTRGTLGIQTMGVVAEHRRRGVGSALLERLRADNPGWRIDPGTTTEQGVVFCRRILEAEPVAREALYPLYREKTTGY